MKSKIGLQKGIEIMLLAARGNPDIKFVARKMAQWIRKYFKELRKKLMTEGKEDGK